MSSVALASMLALVLLDFLALLFAVLAFLFSIVSISTLVQLHVCLSENLPFLIILAIIWASLRAKLRAILVIVVLIGADNFLLTRAAMLVIRATRLVVVWAVVL